MCVKYQVVALFHVFTGFLCSNIVKLYNILQH